MSRYIIKDPTSVMFPMADHVENKKKQLQVNELEQVERLIEISLNIIEEVLTIVNKIKENREDEMIDQF